MELYQIGVRQLHVDYSMDILAVDCLVSNVIFSISYRQILSLFSKYRNFNISNRNTCFHNFSVLEEMELENIDYITWCIFGKNYKVYINKFTKIHGCLLLDMATVSYNSLNLLVDDLPSDIKIS